MQPERKIRDEISPLDGRYREDVTAVRNVCSERALVGYRIEVESKYLLALVKELGLLQDEALADLQHALRYLLLPVSKDEIIDRVFEIEKRTQHDVKAVELAIRESLESVPNLTPVLSFVHFGLTSQDITTTALWIQLRNVRGLLVQQINTIIRKLYNIHHTNERAIMLARTHGQPATPTTLGKEMMVFAERLVRTKESLSAIQIRTKFGGATGGFNAHHAAYPSVDWPRWADAFVQSEFGMQRQQFTTQIDHYDGMAEVCDGVKRINTVLVDLCRDVWQYISMDYFVLKPASSTTAVGSSTMPHKVNPIQFENAEGNLVVANALLEMLARKLPVSRLQRDLTDSTITRNFGTAFGHSYLATVKVLQGLASIAVNRERMAAELNQHWEVVTEGLQTVLRAEGNAEAYDDLKHFVRETVKEEGQVTEHSIRTFVAKVTAPVQVYTEKGQMAGVREVMPEVMATRLRNMRPSNYTPMLPSAEKEAELVHDLF